jgi:hypothetical protein
LGGRHDNQSILAKRHKPYNGRGGGERRVTGSSLALRVLMLLNNRKVTFIFRCPRTGFDVQGWSDGVFEASLAYETVNCMSAKWCIWLIPRRDTSSEATTTNKPGRSGS